MWCISTHLGRWWSCQQQSNLAPKYDWKVVTVTARLLACPMRKTGLLLPVLSLHPHWPSGPEGWLMWCLARASKDYPPLLSLVLNLFLFCPVLQSGQLGEVLISISNSWLIKGSCCLLGNVRGSSITSKLNFSECLKACFLSFSRTSIWKTLTR